MRKPILAPFAVIAVLAVSVSAQVKGINANNQVASIAASVAPDATGARVTERTNALEDTPTNVSSETPVTLRSGTVPPASATTAAYPSIITATMTQSYRVGVGDVLDIQLPASPTTESTLFTVLPGGLLDYPLVGNPV